MSIIIDDRRPRVIHFFFMSLLSASLEPWLPTLCALLVPFALRLLPMFRNPPPHPTPAAPTPLRTPISVLLALYILYTLYTLAFARPPNLFTTLRLPLNAPQSAIHSALLLQQQQLQSNNDHHPLSSATAASSGNGNESPVAPILPPSLEKLLARLASSDARTMLVRCVPLSYPPARGWILPLDTTVSASAPSRPACTARRRQTMRCTLSRPPYSLTH